jgi:aspartyl/asparaginyl beta-hydroxylase (cupin superfamily)
MEMSFKGRLGRLFLGMVNSFFDLYIGGQNRSIVFDIKNINSKLHLLTNNYESIKCEFEKFNDNLTIAEYHKIDTDQYRISGKVNQNKKWKTFILNACGIYSKEALVFCPKTCDYLKQIPNLFQVMFSVLEPGKSIPAHVGPYKGYLRYHLTIKAPTDNPPRIRIKDQYHIWKDGNTILFDDSWEHEVLNNSNQERVILMVDVLRPMPLIPTKLNEIFVKVLFRPLYAREILKNQTEQIDK